MNDLKLYNYKILESMQPLVNIPSYEIKAITLLCDFNIDLLHYELHMQIKNFGTSNTFCILHNC